MKKSIRVVLMAVAAIAIACSSKGSRPTILNSPPTVPVQVPKDSKKPSIEQLTFNGENDQARFSPDGNEIIFQSQDRPAHQHPQIYMMWLQNKKERRISYNDGEDAYPSFGPLGKRIVYASTTDEQKEKIAREELSTSASASVAGLASPSPSPSASPSPLASPSPSASPRRDDIQALNLKFPDFEIYESDADGSHIDRLTQSSGFDAEPVFSRDGKDILFTSVRDGNTELYEMARDGRHPHRITNNKGFTSHGEYSPDGKWIVYSASPDNDTSMQIFVTDRHGKTTRQLTTTPAIHWFPTWTKDGKKILFSSNQDDRTNFELYLITLDGLCLKRLTYAPGSDLAPSFSPDGKKIAFTSNRSGENQIYLMDFNEPEKCSNEAK